MPSSVPVRGVQAPGAWGSPWWHFLPVGLGDRSRLLCSHGVTLADSLDFSKAVSPPENGTTPPRLHGHEEKMSSQNARCKSSNLVYF